MPGSIKGKDTDEVLKNILHSMPRNEWEEKENERIKAVWPFLFKYPDMVKAFCKLIYGYRERITEVEMLTRVCGD